MISTDKISLRPHLNTKIDSVEIIELTEATNNVTIETLSQIIGDFPLSIDIKTNTSILIQNHEQEYEKLITETDKLIEKNSYEMKFEQIGYNNVKTGIISFGTATSFSIILS